jgi:hypothetical protein
MGLTKGDTLYFQGAASYYPVTGQDKFKRAKDLPTVESLKRKLDTSAELPMNAKRHHAAQQ